MRTTPLATLLGFLALSAVTATGCSADTETDDGTTDTGNSGADATGDTAGSDAPGSDASDAAADLSADDASSTPDSALPALPATWEATADDFGCLTEWRPVRGFWLRNALGPEYEDEAVRIAEAGMVEALPPGTIIQLVPQEAMAKLLPGTNPDTGDWEFFNLSAETSGTVIRERGGAEVSNPAGSCMSCHAGAATRDLVCEDTGLCAAAAVPRDLVDALVAGDPRCN